MPVPRSLYLVVGAVAAPVGLCVSAMAPVAGVLAGTIAVGLVMLVSTAGALLAADWRADQQSREAWAEVAPALAEWNPIVREAAEGIERRYLPAFGDDALRDVFRTHRFLPAQTAAVMVLAVARSASGAAPTQSFPTRTACQAAQESTSDGENDAGALLRDGTIDRATLGATRARPTRRLTVVAGQQRARGYCAVGGIRVRLAVNAGSNWLASGRALAAPSHAAEVVVLASCRDTQHTLPAEAATETVCATGTQPPNCRGPPSLEQRRLARRVATTAGRAAPTPNASPDGDGNPLVLDNLGQPVPVCAAEMNVIETYLGDVVEELFASSKANSEPERA